MYPLSQGLFAPRNQWYVAAWDHEVTREPVERWILNKPIAFYRKENGTPVALDGRCPHRSFPLGKSRVVGDNLQCGYHGIAFRPDGSCAEIPTQLIAPSVCKVRAYPLVKRANWLWIWMGEQDGADEGLIPSEEALGTSNDDYVFAGASYNLVQSRYMLLHENLFDLTHLGYLHRTTLGSGGAQNTVPKVNRGDNWIETVYSQKNIPIPEFYAKLANYKGNVDWYQGLKLYLPCLHVGGADIHMPSAGEGRGERLGSNRVLHALTPATRHSTHYFFTLGQTWNKDAAVSQRLFDYVEQNIIPEDITGAVYIEEMIERVGGRPSELLIRSDSACVQGRRMFEKMIRAEEQDSQAVEDLPFRAHQHAAVAEHMI